VTWTSPGTLTLDLSACAAASAISWSLRLCFPRGVTWISSAIALTPATRLVASSAANFSANVGTVPLSVTKPLLAETRSSVAVTDGSHFSSSMTSFCSCVFVFIMINPLIKVGRFLLDHAVQSLSLPGRCISGETGPRRRDGSLVPNRTGGLISIDQAASNERGTERAFSPHPCSMHTLWVWQVPNTFFPISCCLAVSGRSRGRSSGLNIWMWGYPPNAGRQRECRRVTISLGGRARG